MAFPEVEPDAAPRPPLGGGFARLMGCYALACLAATVLLPLLLFIRDAVALGLAATWAAGLGLRNLLFGIEPMNLAVLAATAGVLAGVVFFALYLPSRRAARTDPMVALRSE